MPTFDVEASIRGSLLGSSPQAAIPDEWHPDLRTPFLGRLATAHRSTVVTVYRVRDLHDAPSTTGGDRGAPEVGLSTRCGELLGVGRGATVTLRLTVPDFRSCTVASARIDDLPPPDVVQVSDGRRRWMLATCNSVVFPVRVRPRTHVSSDVVRTSMAFRTLVGAKAGDEVQLAEAPEAFARVDWTDPIRVLGRGARGGWRTPVSVTSAALVCWRRLEYTFELLLRMLFRAPGYAVRTTQAHVGDDFVDLVRLSDSAMELLGVRPGDQVFVCWGLRRTTAQVQRDLPVNPSVDGASEGATSRVERLRDDLPLDFPPHLVARVSASIRRDLGCPPSTVLVLRRRLRTLLQRHLGALVIPVIALFVALYTTNKVEWWLKVVVTVVVFAFALADVRQARTAKGPWP